MVSVTVEPLGAARLQEPAQLTGRDAQLRPEWAGLQPTREPRSGPVRRPRDAPARA
jgi:hypothetical protein